MDESNEEDIEPEKASTPDVATRSLSAIFQDLPEVTVPYITEPNIKSEYCLVLDLDETLIHYFDVKILIKFQMGSESHFLV